MVLNPCLVTTDEELLQIMQLQQQNLKQHFTEEEKNEQGFLTIHHSLEVLQQMNALAPSVIIKDNDKVVAFALTETKECRSLVPSLEPMFAIIEQCSWKGKPINDYRYYTMGQICVAKEYRGQGLFEQLYLHHKKIYQSQFELFITEISTSNYRSQRAHEKVGFKSIHTHKDQLDEWMLVVWDWS
jgi:ribosomal protein S18 acetylase RimI-like enzyme